MLDVSKIWKKTLEEIKPSMNPAGYNTWLKKSEGYSFENGVFTVSVINKLAGDWVKERYYSKILGILKEADDSVESLEFTTDSIEKNKDKEKSKDSELPLNDHYIDLNDNLNPKYTFDTFVVGSFNELAFAATQAIIKKPAVYNPLFLYGNTGVGKTHLMQAVGHYYKNNLSKKVYYITSERFTNEYVSSLQNNKTNAFKEKYKKYDLLIMDDIQFLSNKERTQEELFHLFNFLYDNHKQIIFSSDLHPNYLQNLESRLKSRFSQGMLIDIIKIDTESKIAIIQTKLKQSEKELAPDIIMYLAEILDGSIREIEGLINNICIKSDILGRAMTLDEIKDMTKNSNKKTGLLEFKDIIKAVANFYQIEERFIIEKNRKQEFVKPRQILMYLLRTFYNYSLASIGEKLGGRDHTTVMHAVEKITEDIKNDKELADEIAKLKPILNL